MAELNEKVVKVLTAPANMWYLGTYDNEPNAVPVGFKNVEDGKLTVGDVFLNVTLKNIEKNGKVAVSVCDMKTMEGYQIKGTAVHVTEGKYVEEYKKAAEAMFKGKATAKGALVITPEKVIVTTPGPDNGKVI